MAMAIVGFIKSVFQSFGKDKVGQLSAAFAYSALFAIGPLLLVLVSIIGFIYGERATQGQLATQLSGIFGPDTAKTLQNVVAHTHQSGGGVLALVIGIIGMLLGAAGITTQLQSSFNTILSVVPDPKGGIKRTIYVKLKNALLVIAGGIVVAASLVISALLVGLGTRIQNQIGTPPLLLELVNNLLSLGILTSILYLVYRVVPDVIIPRRVALSAAALITILFVIGKIVLGIIIGRNSTASAYGAAASLITLLLWINYSGQILFIGAEGIKIYGKIHSLQYRPKKFNLKRTTIHIDGSHGVTGLAGAWVRGFKKGLSK